MPYKGNRESSPLKTIIPPYIRSSRDRKLINEWWPKVFYDKNNLRNLARGCKLYSRRGYGLIYHYIIAGKLRYVGQTRESSLRRRMVRFQANGRTGYSYAIKRHLLNAFRNGSLRIQTQEVPVSRLESIETEQIRYYSQQYRLWNKRGNPRYSPSNRWY